ncbi:MAG: extracellular solute-binding protein family 1, partial [Paenibacillaceae bacterium]|nr:extracellular solute-binding protein family 1 [Paenibacillaceae bacterium]
MLLKKTMVLVSAAVMVSSMLAACGSKEEAGSVPDETTPLAIRIFARQQAPEATASDNLILKELEKLTNTKMDITWVPVNTLQEKTKVTIAGGDIPDVMYINDPFDPLFVQSAREGAFWDLTPYIKEYPLLKAFPEGAWVNSQIDGKNFGVPRPRPEEGGGDFPLIRKDWLDKLGLPVPKTAEDYYKAAKAFIQNDPDGNNQADTHGITGNVSPDGMGSFGWIEMLHTGVTTGTWMLKEGKLSLTQLDPGIKKSLEFMKKLYDEKIIPADFAVIKNSQVRDAFMANKAGIMSGAVNVGWLTLSTLLKVVPSADVIAVDYLQGPQGPVVSKTTGLFGMFAIPKSVPEAKMKRVLGFLEKTVDVEIANVAKYGLKDVHYTRDGKDPLFVTSTEKAKTDNIADTANNLSQIFSIYDKYSYAYYTGIPTDKYERNKKVIDERTKVSVAPLPSGMISETWTMVGPDMNKKIQDLKIKIIMGKE